MGQPALFDDDPPSPATLAKQGDSVLQQDKAFSPIQPSRAVEDEVMASG